MQLIHFIWLVRGLAGLAIGFVIARKLRNFIRSIVIMCIPVKYRISEKSFQIQTRVTTLVAIILAVLIAIGLNYGLSKGLAQTSIFKQTNSTTATTTAAPVTFVPPIVPKPSVPNIPASDIENLSEELPTVSEKLPMPLVERDNNTLAPKIMPPVPPISYDSPMKAPTVYTVPYYVQIYAFSSLDKAEKQQMHWEQTGQLPVKIGYMAQEKTPYKVLIGPFKNRLAAVSFLQQNAVKGFVRPAPSLQVFE